MSGRLSKRRRTESQTPEPSTSEPSSQLELDTHIKALHQVLESFAQPARDPEEGDGETSTYINELIPFDPLALSLRLDALAAKARRLYNRQQPIAKIPLEVVDHIIGYLRETAQPQDDAACLCVPIDPKWRRVTKIWSDWRTIAVSNPSYWTRIRVSPSKPFPQVQLWLEYTRDQPLQLEVDGNRRDEHPSDGTKAIFHELSRVDQLCMHGCISPWVQASMVGPQCKRLERLHIWADLYFTHSARGFDDFYYYLADPVSGTPPPAQVDMDPRHRLQTIGDRRLPALKELHLCFLHAYTRALSPVKKSGRSCGKEKTTYFDTLETLRLSQQVFFSYVEDVTQAVQKAFHDLLRDNRACLQDIVFEGIMAEDSVLRDPDLARKIAKAQARKEKVPLDKLRRLRLANVSYESAAWVVSQFTSKSQYLDLEIAPRRTEHDKPNIVIRHLLDACQLAFPEEIFHYSHAAIHITPDDHYSFIAFGPHSTLRIWRVSSKTKVPFKEEIAVISELLLGSVVDLRIRIEGAGQAEPSEARRAALQSILGNTPQLRHLYIQFDEDDLYSHVLTVLEKRPAPFTLVIVEPRAFLCQPFFQALLGVKTKISRWPRLKLYGAPRPTDLDTYGLDGDTDMEEESKPFERVDSYRSLAPLSQLTWVARSSPVSEFDEDDNPDKVTRYQWLRGLEDRRGVRMKWDDELPQPDFTPEMSEELRAVWRHWPDQPSEEKDWKEVVDDKKPDRDGSQDDGPYHHGFSRDYYDNTQSDAGIPWQDDEQSQAF
ncbi:hypothetical protein EIP86_004968 [Pleurotus ostreatoroseus]|nr:hypothetical protein EIP86_004968 [Pleurotus ostreatoroseus]